MPTMPVVDPAIVATSATSGTLRYSAFSPVTAVTESPKTTLSVSRNATGKSTAWTSVMGVRADRTSSRRVSTPVCDSSARSDFSEWRWATTAAPVSTAISLSAGRPRQPTAVSPP